MKETEKILEKISLVITSWVGVCGLHYYGSYWYKGRSVAELNWVPPDNQRKMLNSLEDKSYRLKKGENTIKFLREHDLIEEAKKQWKELFPYADVLVFNEEILDTRGET